MRWRQDIDKRKLTWSRDWNLDLHFHLLSSFYTSLSLNWILKRWNKFLRLWLFGTLDIEEYFSLLFTSPLNPHSRSKWRGKACLPSEGPVAPREGGANPPVPKTQQGWWTASSGFFPFVRAESVSEVSRHCFQIKEERKQRHWKNAFWWASRFEGTGA